jgi:nucleolin
MVNNKKREKEDSTSTSEDEAPVKKPVLPKSTPKIIQKKGTKSDESSEDEASPPKKPVVAAKPTPKAVQKKDGTSDDSSEDEASQKKPAPKVTPKAAPTKTETSDESSEDERPVKKGIKRPADTVLTNGSSKKVMLNGTNGTENGVHESDENSTSKSLKRRAADTSLDMGSAKKPATDTRRKSEPFRRVTGSIYDVPEKLRDNSYQHRADPWGEKANNDFKKVQGKSFRHEKTKKKRGSYAGGKISQEVNSHKFDDSD